MYKLEFTLKQHTPLIHFQHDQAGATLRATEVKPKLDFFIMKKLLQPIDPSIPDNKIRDRFREIALKKLPNGSDHNWKNWMVGNGDHAALDYKLRILPLTIEKKHYYTSNASSNNKDPKFAKVVEDSLGAEYVGQTQYFANNENLKEYEIKDMDVVKLGVFNSEIRCEIICFDLILRGFIETILIDFFLSQNFSCRNSKGFGCFSIIAINGIEKPFVEQDLMNQYDVIFKVVQKVNDYNKALQEISGIYKLLKAGRGRYEQGGYKKSLLFRYFVLQPNPIRWEKRKIKKEIKSNYFKQPKSDGSFENIKLAYTDDPCSDLSDNKNWNDPIIPYDYKYIRALLGLAESYEFLANEIEETKFKYYVKVKSNNGIERFKSPITFKYIDNTIYICSISISSEILNSTLNPVSFNFDKRLKRNHKLQEKPLATDFIKNLETPNSFNIGDFLDFAFNRDAEKIIGIIPLKNNLIP